MTGMVPHPVVGVISDSRDLSSYCVSCLAPFDVFVPPIETGKRVQLIEPQLGNRGECRSCRAGVGLVSSNCSLISCDRSSLRY